jgi:hypothetical protein
MAGVQFEDLYQGVPSGMLYMIEESVPRREQSTAAKAAPGQGAKRHR